MRFLPEGKMVLLDRRTTDKYNNNYFVAFSQFKKKFQKMLKHDNNEINQY